MKWFILQLLSCMLIYSCSRQNSALSGDRHLSEENAPIASGETTSTIHDSILVVFQDRNDNFWFGSNGFGVYKYNGKTLTHFTRKDGLCDDHVWKIQEDKAGHMYFTTIGGISKYNGKRFETLRATNTYSSTQGWKLQRDDLWFQGAQDSGVVYRYDGKVLYRLEFPKTKAAENFISEHPRAEFPNMKFNPYDVYSIFKDSKGNMWFGTGMLGICLYDGKTFKWIPNNQIGMDENAFCVRSVIEDQEGKFWFSNTKNRYIIYRKDSIIFKEEQEIGTSKDQYEEDFTYFISGLTDNNGGLWLATFGAGVWKYDGKTIINYPIKHNDKNVTLYSIYQDHQGILWLGTHTAGAYKFNGKAFEKFKP
jgi:ligand-binding sensor domain-containing protein